MYEALNSVQFIQGSPTGAPRRTGLPNGSARNAGNPAMHAHNLNTFWQSVRARLKELTEVLYFSFFLSLSLSSLHMSHCVCCCFLLLWIFFFGFLFVCRICFDCSYANIAYPCIYIDICIDLFSSLRGLHVDLGLSLSLPSMCPHFLLMPLMKSNAGCTGGTCSQMPCVCLF